VESDRWAVAPSIAFGLNTDTTLTVAYLHQEDDRTPDYGVPFARHSTTDVATPVTEHGVSRSTWYGKDKDMDKTNVDVLTAKFSHDANDWLSLYNDTRLGFYSRDWSPSPPTCPDATCSNRLFGSGTPLVSYGAGGGSSYLQDSWGIQNVTTGVAKFDTWSFRHEVVAGIDTFYQNDKRKALAYSPAGSKTPTSLFDPSHDSNYDLIRNPAADKESSATNVALFLSERFWIIDELSLIGGVRWDNFDSKYQQGNGAKLTSHSSQINPKASIVWEPAKSQTYYFSYATSTSPQGQFPASGVTPLGTARDLDPERNESFEIGAKISLFDDRLGLTGALFRINKNNAKGTNPDTGDVVVSGNEQRVQGIELGITGKVTKDWTINFNYTYLDSETLDVSNAANAANIGKKVGGVPPNSFSLWSTYDLTSLFDAGPGRLVLGAGVTYRDGMAIRDDGMARIPYSLSVDAMLSYQLEHVGFQLNGYNLGNRLNYDSFFQGENPTSARAVPAPGRTLLFTVSSTF
jgi:catecholate siderophore receptor